MSDEPTYVPNPIETGKPVYASIQHALHSIRQEEKAAETPAPEKAPVREPEPVAEEEPAAQETAPSEAETAETEVAEALPPIDPPASWKGDAKEKFSALPREVQEQILELDRAAVKEINSKQQEAAERRKAADAAREAAENEIKRYQQQLQTYIPMLQQQVMGEFSDIKTLTDAQNLAASDPARWARWSQAQQTLQSALADAQRLSQEAQLKAIKEHNERTSAERTKLTEKLPELAADEAYSKFASDLSKYLKNEGFADEEIAQLTDHRTAIVARKAMLYDRAQEAAKKAAVKVVPKVQQPGAGNSKAGHAAETLAQRAQKLAERGADIRDFAKLLRVS